MKTKLTISCILLSATLMAQVSNLPTVLNLNERIEEYGYGVVPKSLSYDGNNRVYIRLEDDLVGIYSNTFSPIKQFVITPTYRSDVAETQEIASEYATFLFSGSKDPLQDIPSTWTDEEVKNFLDTVSSYPFDGSITILSYRPHPEGGTMFVPDIDNDNYYEFEKFGKEYPKTYYLRQENTIYICYDVYYQMAYTYTDNWIEGEERRSIILYGLNYVNYDNDVTRDSKSGDGLCLTQTLFNEDTNYEYLHFPISSYTAREPYGPMCANCPNYREKYGTYTSFNVMSEDGTILQTVSFPNGFKMVRYINAEIIKLSNEHYIICTGEMGENAAMLIYKINRTNSGAAVQQVSEPQKISGAYKFLHNGHVYIKNADKTYTLTGQEVK